MLRTSRLRIPDAFNAWRRRVLGTPVVAPWREWKKIRARQRAEHPVLYFVLETIPGSFRRIGRYIYDAKWAVFHRLHPGHRYHIIRTGLQPGYYDVDTLMLHGMMALVVRYVEDEHGGEDELAKHIGWLESEDSIDRNAPEELQDHSPWIRSESEALAIYRWWKHEWKKGWDAYDAALHARYGEIDFDPLDFTGPDEDNRADPNWPKYEAWRAAQTVDLDAMKHELIAKEQAMLTRLVAIRGALWT